MKYSLCYKERPRFRVIFLVFLVDTYEVGVSLAIVP